MKFTDNDPLNGLRYKNLPANIGLALIGPFIYLALGIGNGIASGFRDYVNDVKLIYTVFFKTLKKNALREMNPAPREPYVNRIPSPFDDNDRVPTSFFESKSNVVSEPKVLEFSTVAEKTRGVNFADETEIYENGWVRPKTAPKVVEYHDGNRKSKRKRVSKKAKS